MLRFGKRVMCFVWFLCACLSSADVVVELDVKFPMRDGAQLATNVFRPSKEGRYPTILVRSPYGKGDSNNKGARAYAETDYAYVIQDTRGRGQSEGVFAPFLTEAEDGFDTQEWVRQQPWSDGSIGTSGGSYVGFTQWLPAPLGSPALKTMVPAVTFSNLHDDIAYIGGAFQLSLALGWAAVVTSVPDENIVAKDWAGILCHVPLKEYPTVLGRSIAFYDDWLDHPNDDPYWRPASIVGKYKDIRVPALNVGGWYDIFSQATTENFRRMRADAPSDEVRRSQRLIMGPGGHGNPTGKAGNRDVGESALKLGEIERRWFDHWLKGLENGVEDDAPVKIFVMGANVWRDEHEWPLARTNYTDFYLHSKGNANTSSGDGSLNTTLPSDEPSDGFVYDPDDPVSSTGGANLFYVATGAFDQRPVETRPDVLVYTSEPLTESLEVTGPVRVKLYAASSPLDTDFTAKLVDVGPDGTAWNLTDGIIRARYRNSDTEPELLEPGKVYEYTIDLWVTSNVFLPGHCVRLEVSSSNFPRFDRNPNTGHPFGKDAAFVTAQQSVFHSTLYPSRLILPLIPPK